MFFHSLRDPTTQLLSHFNELLDAETFRKDVRQLGIGFDFDDRDLLFRQLLSKPVALYIEEFRRWRRSALRQVGQNQSSVVIFMNNRVSHAE